MYNKCVKNIQRNYFVPIVSTSIKIDARTKKEAQELFKDMGMSLTTAVNIFLKQAVREQRIPFYVGQPKYKEEVYQAMRDVEQGKNLSKSYRSAKEMIEDILKDE
jgi:addiction module antitoxin, relB/dinJ family